MTLSSTLLPLSTVAAAGKQPSALLRGSYGEFPGEMF